MCEGNWQEGLCPRWRRCLLRLQPPQTPGIAALTGEAMPVLPKLLPRAVTAHHGQQCSHFAALVAAVKPPPSPKENPRQETKTQPNKPSRQAPPPAAACGVPPPSLDLEDAAVCQLVSHGPCQDTSPSSPSGGGTPELYHWHHFTEHPGVLLRGAETRHGRHLSTAAPLGTVDGKPQRGSCAPEPLCCGQRMAPLLQTALLGHTGHPDPPVVTAGSSTRSCSCSVRCVSQKHSSFRGRTRSRAALRNASFGTKGFILRAAPSRLEVSFE